MTEADIIGKLSRIFETHAFAGEDADFDLDDLLDDFNSPEFSSSMRGGPFAATAASPYRHNQSPERDFGIQNSRNMLNTDRPQPYEIWQQKHSNNNAPKQAKKLTGEQWDRLVEKMHQSNRVKQSTMIKEQNQGLALELGGYLFKPRINKTSADLSATMKSLPQRMPEMLAERKKEMEAKRREAAENEVADCTFAPKRSGATMSNLYLAKSGRKKMTPEQLIQFEQEKQRRIEMRKQIIEDIESKELTFKPQLGEKSLKLQEKLLQKGKIERDPVTKTAVVSMNPASPRATLHKTSRGATMLQFNSEMGTDARYEEGPVLIIESEHPYRNNTNEFTTVQIPGAVSYTLTFHEETKTEAVYDYIKFYDDETHTEYFGCGKYSGGANGSSCNWPGVGGRPPLVIPASKFVINFKTNGSVNDWGFRMNIIPTLLVANKDTEVTDTYSLNTPSAVPNISDAGKQFRHGDNVHDRLYRQGVLKQAEISNQTLDLMQSKLRISLKPWETARTANGLAAVSFDGGLSQASVPVGNPFVKIYSKTHLPKAPLSDYIEEMVVAEEDAILIERTNRGDSSPARDAMTMQELHNQSMYTSSKASAKKSLTVVEFDESLSNLWRQLRVV